MLTKKGYQRMTMRNLYEERKKFGPISRFSSEKTGNPLGGVPVFKKTKLFPFLFLEGSPKDHYERKVYKL